MTQSLTTRFGWMQERMIFFHAALLAAHSAQTKADGFSAADVRFFFLLFTNWVEHDVTRPGQDVELTQLRRILERLVRERWAVRTPERRGGRERGRRFVLRDEGIVGLAGALADAVSADRPFEEGLFVVCFASSYGQALRARVRGHATTRAIQKEVATLIDPRALAARLRRHTQRLLADVEERIISGRTLASEAAGAKDDDDAIRRLEAHGSYQLHHVRPLRELLRALPEDVRRFELTRGIALRVDLLFEPLAARARAELRALDSLDRTLVNCSSRPR